MAKEIPRDKKVGDAELEGEVDEVKDVEKNTDDTPTDDNGEAQE
jgi:hypothetical protein